MKHSANTKSQAELDIIRQGGARLAAIVERLCAETRPGMTTGDIDILARDLIARVGGESAFLGYRPAGVKRPFPASVCVSVNDEIVHGIPGERILREGDIVTIDCGLKYKGLFTDHAVTIILGPASEALQQLVHICRDSLYIGVDACRPGATNLSAGCDIQQFAAGRYGIVRELSGHGVGYAVHEDPYVPNYAMRGRATQLQPGMVLAVEPMLTVGPANVLFLDDEYTVVTASGKNAAHFEHTIIITDGDPEIVTLAGKYVI
jgi:methionyl aminopeptidase